MAIANFFEFTVKLYQKYAATMFYPLLKAVFPVECRFVPTCSEYAREAIQAEGAWRGLLLAVKRIGRCHPWHPGGVDLVLPPDELKR